MIFILFWTHIDACPSRTNILEPLNPDAILDIHKRPTIIRIESNWWIRLRIESPWQRKEWRTLPVWPMMKDDSTNRNIYACLPFCLLLPRTPSRWSWGWLFLSRGGPSFPTRTSLCLLLLFIVISF